MAQLHLERMAEEDLGGASGGSSTSTTPPRRRQPVPHPHRHGEPPSNRSTFGPHRESGDRVHEFRGLYLKCNFRCSLGRIQKFGETSVRTISEFSMCLNQGGSL